MSSADIYFSPLPYPPVNIADGGDAKRNSVVKCLDDGRRISKLLIPCAESRYSEAELLISVLRIASIGGVANLCGRRLALDNRCVF